MPTNNVKPLPIKKTQGKLTKAQSLTETQQTSAEKVNETTAKRSRASKVSKQRCKREGPSSTATTKRANSHMTKANNNSNASSNSNDLPNIPLDEQHFTKNALFHTPTSLLTKLDLKVLFQPVIFESFPRHSQLKLIKLLPECDRQLDSHGSFK